MSTALAEATHENVTETDETLVPLAVTFGLYVTVPVVVPGSQESAKTTYSTQHEANSD